jgi:hypothetical protein
MPSSGTASDISPQDAGDLLSKFITESTKLQVVFLTSNNIISAGLHGILRAASPTTLVVKPDNSPDAPFLTFSLGAAVGFRYAAGRAIPEVPLPPNLRITSGLVLTYPHSSQIYSLELADD